MTTRLWLKLDAHYNEDPAILELDPLVELLFIRSLCLSKRFGSDGFIHRAQLKLILPEGCDKTEAFTLVEAELWSESTDPPGWWICAWDNWQTSPTGQQKGASWTNHKRWHLDKGHFHPECRYCITNDP